jgi:hypothetical protein
MNYGTRKISMVEHRFGSQALSPNWRRKWHTRRVEAHFYFRSILEDPLDGAMLIERPSGANYAGPARAASRSSARLLSLVDKDGAV